MITSTPKYKYDSIHRYYLIKENFLKQKFDDAVVAFGKLLFDLQFSITSNSFNVLKLKYGIDKIHFTGWSYDSNTEEMILTNDESKEDVHAIYFRYIFDSDILGALSVEERSEENQGLPDDPIIIDVYINNLPLKRSFSSIIIHEFIHIYDMYGNDANIAEFSNDTKYSNVFNQEYYDKLKEMGVVDIFKDVRLINAPAFVMMTFSKTERRAKKEEIERYIDDNETFILTHFHPRHRDSDDFAMQFLYDFNNELTTNLKLFNYIKTVLENEQDDCNDNFAFSIYMTSVFMQQGFLTTKDTTGFSDFKYMKDVINGTLEYNSYITSTIEEADEFFIESINDYVDYLIQTVLFKLKTSGIYDKLSHLFETIKLKAIYDMPEDLLLEEASLHIKAVTQRQATLTKEQHVKHFLKGEINRLINCTII